MSDDADYPSKSERVMEWNSMWAVAVRVVRTLTGGKVQQDISADGGGTVSQSPIVSGHNNQINYGTPAAAVPANWWERPGAPQFGWDGGITAGECPKLDPRVRQTGGGEIGRLRMSMTGAGVKLEPQSPIGRGQQLCLPETTFPEPKGDPVVMTLSFWWGGAERSVQWDIPFEAHAKELAPNPPYRPSRCS